MIEIILSIFCGIGFFFALKLYLRVRGVSNSLQALAGKEFHEKASSIMESADELSEAVLSHIEFLNSSALDGRRPLKFYLNLRRFGRSKLKMDVERTEKIHQFQNDISSLRPELRQLLGEITALWLNWIINRNIFIGFLISLELKKTMVRAGHINESPAAVGESIFAKLDGEFC